MMADHPMIFSAPMIRALLAGAKTQHRIALKLPTKGIYERKDMGGWEPTINGGGGCFTIARDGSRSPVPETVGIWHRTTGRCLNVPWRVGDRVWCREECLAEELSRPRITRAATKREREHLKRTEVIVLDELDGCDGVRYLADDAWQHIENTQEAGDLWSELFHYRGRGEKGRGNKVPAIRMPRWASRITLTVKEVRVQRAQEISEADAKAEGCMAKGIAWGGAVGTPETSARDDYACLWDIIHGEGAFARNDWVCAISFTVDPRNIDHATQRGAA